MRTWAMRLAAAFFILALAACSTDLRDDGVSEEAPPINASYYGSIPDAAHRWP